MMHFIDTHAHLFLKEFDDDRSEIIERARAKGISRFILPNVDSTTSSALLEVVALYPEVCFPALGLHPTSVNKENWQDELNQIVGCINEHHKKLVAIGEIGLDLYWDKSALPQQLEVFETQVELARKYSLPLIIHTRDAFDEMLKLMKRIHTSELKGVFHCFTGNVQQAHTITEMGFYLGIGGVITYKNGGLDQVVSEIGINHLVLETDSPYLPPVPYRGKRNESSYLLHIADRLATIKGIALEEIARATTRNACKLFGFDMGLFY